ncbi:MAG: hypothetical protein KDE01_06520, partial [Caldilineaceae bacterium]|nr:hypothetical protein [Caldilineaceae bacterium]
KQAFLPCAVDDRTAIRLAGESAGAQIAVKGVNLVYDVGILGAATVRFVDTKRDINAQDEVLLLASGGRQMTGLDWGRAERLPLAPNDLGSDPEPVDSAQGPFFAEPPEGFSSVKAYSSAAKDLADWLYYNEALDLTVHPDLGVYRKPGEDERSFTIRLQQAARERRDDEVDKLRARADKEIQRV